MAMANSLNDDSTADPSAKRVAAVMQ